MKRSGRVEGARRAARAEWIRRQETPRWDRRGQIKSPQGAQAWNRNMNLSWRLKTSPGKSEHIEVLMTSSSVDGIQSDNPNTTPTAVKKEVELARRVFCQKCGGRRTSC